MDDLDQRAEDQYRPPRLAWGAYGASIVLFTLWCVLAGA